jgi:hypothetical protein
MSHSGRTFSRSCIHCYRSFDTPLERELHEEKCGKEREPLLARLKRWLLALVR